MTAPDAPVLGVILAAGKGTRMLPFSERYPKPILPILGKPLLQHQIECLRDIGVRRVIVVIGHLGFAIVGALGDGRELGVEIEYVDQGQTLGIAHAVGKLEPIVDRPFMLFLGDIFFLHENLGSMLAMLGRNDVHGVLAVKEEPSAEAIRRNFVVLEDAQGFVRRVIEKPRYPATRVKGCGLYLFDPTFFDAVRRTPRTAMRDEYEITDAIQIFVDDGHRVRTARVIREDLNLSEPADLLDINLRLLGDDNLIGSNVRLPAGCRVERSVIMDGAVVERPIAIRDSLVFPGVTVTAPYDLSRTIVLADQTIECR
ncbi:MAG TPA: sugar phosphate nucleotidyltransferase [Candidatus Dormibacteraeota bacterium]|nr:sugar phosphate nucleotidyltransferase [Candidatus Dormibacteraeota bacterium]